VREPKPIKGARAPLFDRLVDREPAAKVEVRPLRILDRAQLRDSVEREISRLLNTRAHERSTHADYGLPEFSALAASGATDRFALSALIARKLTAHEPRLRKVHVTLEADPSNPRALLGRVDAMLVMDSVNDPVSFPLLIDRKTGAVELAEAPPPAPKAERAKA
jgi:type VI secretion system protein ImpF